MRAWFTATLFAAAWLAVLFGWQDIAWYGKQHRLRGALEAYTTIVENLRTDWPERDGQRNGIGQFMAYPVSAPETLILLTLPEFDGTTTTLR